MNATELTYAWPTGPLSDRDYMVEGVKLTVHSRRSLTEEQAVQLAAILGLLGEFAKGIERFAPPSLAEGEE